MGISTLVNLLALMALLCEGRGIKGQNDEVSVVTREFERIPLHHALSTLEETVKEGKEVEWFCYKHFEVGRFKGDCSSDSDETKKENETEKSNVPDQCQTPTHCADLFYGGSRISGVYTVVVPISIFSSKQIQVYCDMETDDGGWTVFQRRGSFPPQMNFSRNWSDYANGFGDLHQEFWLGNDNIHVLSVQEQMMLRVDLGDFEGYVRHAKYKGFRMEAPEEDYKIHFNNYSGDAGDSLELHRGKKFVTYDRNDFYDCAKNYRGGWWYDISHNSNLNGEYNNTVQSKGVIWTHWLGNKVSLKWSEMKFRPESFDARKQINLCH